MSNGRFGSKPKNSKNVLSFMSSDGSYLHYYNKKFSRLYEELKTKSKEDIQKRFNILLHLIINWKRRRK